MKTGTSTAAFANLTGEINQNCLGGQQIMGKDFFQIDSRKIFYECVEKFQKEISVVLQPQYLEELLAKIEEDNENGKREILNNRLACFKGIAIEYIKINPKYDDPIMLPFTGGSSDNFEGIHYWFNELSLIYGMQCFLKMDIAEATRYANLNRTKTIIESITDELSKINSPKAELFYDLFELWAFGRKSISESLNMYDKLSTEKFKAVVHEARTGANIMGMAYWIGWSATYNMMPPLNKLEAEEMAQRHGFSVQELNAGGYSTAEIMQMIGRRIDSQRKQQSNKHVKDQLYTETTPATRHANQPPKAKNITKPKTGIYAITQLEAANACGVIVQTIRRWDKNPPKNYPGRFNFSNFMVFAENYKIEKRLKEQGDINA